MDDPEQCLADNLHALAYLLTEKMSINSAPLTITQAQFLSLLQFLRKTAACGRKCFK
jgi:hypothetical protein